MISLPPKIEILPEHLIDQIKAGEVIERPGNLIKEILENAVDAGATKLELIVKNNGLDLIALSDDGHGMGFNDLPLAFSRHATSKISRFEDLYKLHSYGFRGEALASIASISRLQCISFVAGMELGAEIRLEGGMTLLHEQRQKSGKKQGTELVIQDLFYNTPARLKFIQSQNSEKQFIKKIVYAFIFSNPSIEFQIKFNDDEKEIFPAVNDIAQRLLQVFPKAKGLLLHSHRQYDGIDFNIYLLPGNIRGPVKCQHLHINGRYILDKQLHRVISNALQASQGHDEFHYLALLTLPADSIDVNVHPNKTVIKCLNTSRMISLITSTIRDLFSQMSKMEITPTGPGDFSPAMLGELATAVPGLQQERHEYNMEGFFSPHNLPGKREDDLYWVGKYFIVTQENKWWAVSPLALLETYIHEKLKSNSQIVPLLVSEPYPAIAISLNRVDELKKAGLELEFLGAETLVLRGIPEWMNGFPLQPIVLRLLRQESLKDMVINPTDWSSSTWKEMLDILPHQLLLEQKVLLDLARLLQEKLK
jgi:DNA mismatch repair protein MutL